MAYGTILADTLQSSTANTPVVFKDGNGTETGTLCRAWVNFNGTGTVAIRASFNVSSITDNGTGNYTVNFTTALPDANYSMAGCIGNGVSDSAGTAWTVSFYNNSTRTASSVRIECNFTNTAAIGLFDADPVTIQIFR